MSAIPAAAHRPAPASAERVRPRPKGEVEEDEAKDERCVGRIGDGVEERRAAEQDRDRRPRPVAGSEPVDEEKDREEARDELRVVDQHRCGSPGRSGGRLLDQHVLDEERVEAGGGEDGDGVLDGVGDRLAQHVEAGIEHHGNVCRAAEILQKG